MPKNRAKRRSKKHVLAGRLAHQVHQVKASINLEEIPQAKSAIKLTILNDGEVLGHLTIGRGSITWLGRGRKSIRTKLDWPRFAQLMDQI